MRHTQHQGILQGHRKALKRKEQTGYLIRLRFPWQNQIKQDRAMLTTHSVKLDEDESSRDLNRRDN